VWGPIKIITNAVLCKTCSVLLCVLEQPRVDNSSADPIRSNWTNWPIVGPVKSNILLSQCMKRGHVFTFLYQRRFHSLSFYCLESCFSSLLFISGVKLTRMGFLFSLDLSQSALGKAWRSSPFRYICKPVLFWSTTYNEHLNIEEWMSSN